jgi:peptide/nickel transport system substrate-binding protein
MLAEKWGVSDDGLTWRVTIREGVAFHDGTRLTADIVRDVLNDALPRTLGTAKDDFESIEVVSPNELLIKLRARLTFLPETLAVTVAAPGSKAGTGPFHRVAPLDDKAPPPSGRAELLANETYHGGRPHIDRIVIEPYKSVRAAWADMLRGNVDMLYEVGADALDLVRPAKNTHLFTFDRPYAVLVFLNTRRPGLGTATVRRALNTAINRDEIISKGMNGLGRPADGPLWPDHWANSANRPRFQYQPSSLIENKQPVKFTLLYSDPTHERIALLIQRQLQSVGINVSLEETTVTEGQKRASTGDFDAWIADVGLGPAFFRQMIFWQSASPYNGGGYSNKAVDAAFMRIRRATNDDEYRAGVAAFQQAIADDPPAIFVAWTERARAVSTRFEVPSQPGRDILRGGSVALWRPAVMPQLASRN